MTPSMPTSTTTPARRRGIGVLGGAAILAAAALTSTALAGTALNAAQPAAAAVSTVFTLDGTYTDGGSARPVIRNVNDILTVDMSSQGRPTATGVVVNGDTILVTFPDDATYGAKLIAPDTIAWSNGSYWQKVQLVSVPNVVGMYSSQAVSTLRGRGFGVSVTRPLDCEADGTVTRQSPAGGRLALPGSTVNITVPGPRIKPPCP